MEQELNNIYNGLVVCYKSLNNGLRELYYLLENNKRAYSLTETIENDDIIFEMNLLDNIFYFYYNSWNKLKIKYYKDLLNLDYWIENAERNRNIIIYQSPKFIELTSLTKSIISKIEEKDNQQELKRILAYHKNIWFNYNNNLLDELVFNQVKVNSSSIRYFNTLDSKLISKKKSDTIKYSKSRLIQKTNNILKSEIDKMKKQKLKMDNYILKSEIDKYQKINI